MAIWDRLLKAISCFFDGDEEESECIPKNKFLVLRPDGSWIIDDKNKSNLPNPGRPPIPPISSYAPPPNPCVDVELDAPPIFFPQAEDLKSKLDDCLVAGVVSKCRHIKTKDNVYVLTIDIPYTKTSSIDNTQVTLFIRAMRDKYRLSLASREKVCSTVTCCKHHTLVFEYDPRKILFDKKQ